MPIGHVTNGIHVPSWHSAEAEKLWSDSCGGQPWLGTTDKMAAQIRDIPDARLWRFRAAASAALVSFVRGRLALQLTASGAASEEIGIARRVLDANVLTLGFARRFATYKRPNLLLHDPERLLRLLNDPQRPVQLILAGKAHPADQPGQEMIRQWIRFIRRPEARRRVVFLSDYDMLSDRAAGAGGGCLAQYAAAALGGERYQRHEGPCQRRHQSVGA